MLVLFTLLNALLGITSDRAHQATLFYQRTVALELLETAVADAIVQLEADPDWNEGFQEKSISPDMPGTYSISFNSSGSGFTAEHSINNLRGDEPAESFRGADTVPPRAVYLVVTAEVGGVLRQAEVILGGSGGQLSSYALAASNNIWMVGNVEVTGISSLSEPEMVEADIHSNRAQDTDNIIIWTPREPGDRADINGTVSATSPNPNAIVFGGTPDTYSVGDTQTGVPARPPPPFDIASEIVAHRGAPAPPLGPGVNVLSGGSYYIGNDVELNGDIQLDGASLYVEGDLALNGSLAGEGSVYVAEETTVRGDTAIVSANSQGVALYSRGRVYLAGFDFEEYVDQMASVDPEVGPLLDEYYESMGYLNDALDSEDWTMFGEALNALGSPTGPVPAGAQNDVLGRLIGRIEALPTDSTQQALVERVTTIRQLLSPVEGNPYNPPGLTPQEIITSWTDDELSNHGGLLDAALQHLVQTGDQGPLEYVEQVYIESEDPIGRASTFFQGIVFSNGYVAVDNSVEMVGSIWAFDDGSQSRQTVEEDGEQFELNPGDILLLNGSKLVLNQEYADQMGSGNTVGAVAVRTWIQR